MSNPIRVLQIVTHMNRGGLETMLMNYYRHIDRSQVQFDFLVHRQERAAYDDEIESLGGKIFRLPKLNPWSPKYINSLNRFFSEHPEYKIVHCHLDCMSAIPLIAAKRAKVPVRIAHCHSSSQDKDLKYIIKVLYKKRIPIVATKLFACSKAAGNWMFNGHSFTLFNNAIDVEKYIFNETMRKIQRQCLNLNENTLVVGHVGRFSIPKNHTFLLDIFYEIDRSCDARLLLVGDGELRPQIERKARLMGIIDHIIFLGVRDDVAVILQAMDVFIFPSLYEGLPLSLIEAQAAGLPCLISDGVSSESRISNLVHQLSLNKSANTWAVNAIQLSDIIRGNTYKEIKNAGFDIIKNAEWLQRFYLSKISAINKSDEDNI